MRTFLGVSIVAVAIAVAGCEASREPTCDGVAEMAAPDCGPPPPGDPVAAYVALCPGTGVFCRMIGGGLAATVGPCEAGGVDGVCTGGDARCPAGGEPRCVRVDVVDCREPDELLFCR